MCYGRTMGGIKKMKRDIDMETAIYKLARHEGKSIKESIEIVESMYDTMNSLIKKKKK